jgi:hypothetical protein
VTALYFGQDWPAHFTEDGIELPEVPTYARCLWCREFFAKGDNGQVMPMIGEVDPDYLVGVGPPMSRMAYAGEGQPSFVARSATLVAQHRECTLAGTVGHTVRVCRCTGWPPNDRDTAREVLRRIQVGYLDR